MHLLFWEQMYWTGRRRQRTVAGRKKSWVSIVSPEFSIMNVVHLIHIFVKVVYFKSGVRIGINHQETGDPGSPLCDFGKPVTAEARPPTGVSAEAEWLAAVSSTNMSPPD